MNKSLYSELEPNTRAFLDNLRQNGGPPIYTLSPSDARAVLCGLQADYWRKGFPNTDLNWGMFGEIFTTG